MAIEIEPDWAPPYEMRAELLLAEGAPGAAIDDFTQAIRFGHPLTVNYQYIRRAVAYMAAGRYDEGLRDLEHVLGEDTDNALAYEVRGQIDAARGERDRAIAAFRAALHYEPTRKGAQEGLRRLGATP
jgi:tetratricopeptide (TPR) repeat protein